MSLVEQSINPRVPAIQGIADVTNQGTAGVGVFGVVGLPDTGLAGAPPLSFVGVYGSTVVYRGVPPGIGVYGASGSGLGVYGTSAESIGVKGESQSGQNAGVFGINDHGGPGVSGSASAWDGVHGESQSNQHAGVAGINNHGNVGVYGSANAWDAIVGETHSDAHAGVTGGNLTTGANGVGIYGVGGKYAGKFDGDVQVNGNLNIGSPAHPGYDVILNDCAEHFEVVDAKAEPGTVMVIDQDGNLRPSSHTYDKKVAGVVSGAGNFRPGIILGKQQSQEKGLLIALIGKVYCKVDAHDAAIEIGDLLTTSPTLGHAMKANDPVRAFGAVIGKALKPLKEGQGLIPILVALQ
jgi:hypothetical protein